MVKCVKVLGGSRRRYAGIGDIIVVSIKEAMPTPVKKGSMPRQWLFVLAAAAVPTVATFVSTRTAPSSSTLRKSLLVLVFGPVAREFVQEVHEDCLLAPEVL